MLVLAAIVTLKDVSTLLRKITLNSYHIGKDCLVLVLAAIVTLKGVYKLLLKIPYTYHIGKNCLVSLCLS